MRLNSSSSFFFRDSTTFFGFEHIISLEFKVISSYWLIILHLFLEIPSLKNVGDIL